MSELIAIGIDVIEKQKQKKWYGLTYVESVIEKRHLDLNTEVNLSEDNSVADDVRNLAEAFVGFRNAFSEEEVESVELYRSLAIIHEQLSSLDVADPMCSGYRNLRNYVLDEFKRMKIAFNASGTFDPYVKFKLSARMIYGEK